MGALRGVRSAGKTLGVSLGDTGKWRGTPRACVSVYYRELVMLCVWLCDLWHFVKTRNRV